MASRERHFLLLFSLTPSQLIMYGGCAHATSAHTVSAITVYIINAIRLILLQYVVANAVAIFAVPLLLLLWWI